MIFIDNKPFKEIEGFHGLYLVSTTGDIYSKKVGRMLRGNMRKGYKGVKLGDNWYSVHRIVAQTYIPNPDNLPQVNHKNGNKLDNSIENLEWCSLSYNIKHAYMNNLCNFKNSADNALKKANYLMEYMIIILVSKNNEKFIFNGTKPAAKFLNTNIEYVSEGMTKNHRIKGYKVYGFKRGDLYKIANGEPLPEVLKGIPWEIRLKSEESCNDYPSEGE